MDRQKLFQPHDRLIKYTYQRKDSAAGLLRGYLPASLLEGIDWASLQVMPGSFVDAALSDLHTDLLYRLNFRGSPLWIYCLFEHQSKPDPWMGLRILGYKRAIWLKMTQDHLKPGEFPPIYPLVVYSGKERWTAPLRWIENLAIPKTAAPEVQQWEVHFEYQLVDLSHLSAEEIRGDVAGRLTLGLIKAAAEDRVLDWLRAAVPLLKMLQQSEVTGMFEALLRYVLAVDSNFHKDNVFAVLENNATPELTRQAMSVADQLIEEGLQKGLEKGLEKGRLEGSIRIFQELLGLPVSEDAELAAKSPEELQQLEKELRARWARR